MPQAGFEPVSSCEWLLEFETDALKHSATTAGFYLALCLSKRFQRTIFCVCVQRVKNEKNDIMLYKLFHWVLDQIISR